MRCHQEPHSDDAVQSAPHGSTRSYVQLATGAVGNSRQDENAAQLQGAEQATSSCWQDADQAPALQDGGMIFTG